MQELYNTIKDISKEWKFWRQRSFDFVSTQVPDDAKFSKEDEIKYLYNAYETAKNDKVLDNLNERCDMATNKLEAYIKTKRYKLCIHMFLISSVFGFAGLILFIVGLAKSLTIPLLISVPLIILGFIISDIARSIDRKYNKLKSEMDEAWQVNTVVTLYYDFVSNRMKYLAELIEKEKPKDKSKKSKKSNRVK